MNHRQQTTRHHQFLKYLAASPLLTSYSAFAQQAELGSARAAWNGSSIC